MRIIVDSAIPFINGVFEPYAQVCYCKGADFTPQLVRDADALVIRTRTKCNSSLLKGSSVKLVATATIGEDHIDKQFCSDNGIAVMNAAGCNAGGVLQYVFTAIYNLAVTKPFKLPPQTGDGVKCVLGIVGVGNVGSRIAEFASKLGFKVLLNDPPRMKRMLQESGRYDNGFVELDELLAESDIVTLHTSLNSTSRNLANAMFFEKMKKGAIFINASRGEVMDETALYENKEKLGGIVVDVWNNEPQISLSTIGISDFHTPHIAGYSLEGKINGTTMSVHNVADFFNIQALKNFKVDTSSFPNPVKIDFGKICSNECKESAVLQMRDKMLSSYNIYRDTENLENNPDQFENLRNKYDYRREFEAIW